MRYRHDLTRMDWCSGPGHVPNIWTDWRDARAHLACSFGLADCLHLMAATRTRVGYRNDCSCSEMISGSWPRVRFTSRPAVGDVPGAFSHVALVNAALSLTGHPQTSGNPRTDNAAE